MRKFLCCGVVMLTACLICYGVGAAIACLGVTLSYICHCQRVDS